MRGEEGGEREQGQDEEKGRKGRMKEGGEWEGRRRERWR